MKLSLAWIFDHIDADWKTQNVDTILALFNQRTAEIESYYRVSYDLSHFFLGTVDQITAQGIILDVPELAKKIALQPRTDITLPSSGAYLIKKEGDEFVWAKRVDFGLEKEGLLPAFDGTTDTQLKGSWREEFESEDVILEVDNKSITHRPDMWCHRGFAREIAAFMGLEFQPQQKFLKNIPVAVFQKNSQPTSTTPLAFHNQAQDACKRFTALYFKSITNKPCLLHIASRLLKVDATPYSAVVDLTNYVMLDWSQPMHAYDASKIDSQQITIRMAHDQETLTLLSGEEIKLAPQDCVVADRKGAQCLAGIKGGLDSSITSSTTSVLLEAANWQASHIRKTAQRHKIRTDSSARFEKTLDPNQTVQSIQRFVYLLEEFGISADYAQEIISLGDDVALPIIEVSHEFLEQRIGLTFTPDQIINLLAPLEFHVLQSMNENKKITYLITIPSFRASKDIKIREDILEEVVRCYGFEKITSQLPRLTRTPFDLSPITQMRKTKYFLAHAAIMTEQQNYSLYDEQYLTQLGLTPETAISLINPVSENFYRMITSLVPGLLKNIQENQVQHDVLSFFECGRTWTQPSHKTSAGRLTNSHHERVKESASVAGIFFKKRADVDFYHCKLHISNLFAALGFDPAAVTWQKSITASSPWYRPYQSAQLLYDKKIIGVAGKIDPMLLSKLDIDTTCDAFVFELDGDFLFNQKPGVITYKPLSKFQETYFDLSLFVPLNLETAMLQKQIAQLSDLIDDVNLIDFFESAFAKASTGQETNQNRALTFRVWLVHHERTLEKSDIDAIWKQSVDAVQALGAQVRM